MNVKFALFCVGVTLKLCGNVVCGHRLPLLNSKLDMNVDLMFIVMDYECVNSFSYHTVWEQMKSMYA